MFVNSDWNGTVAQRDTVAYNFTTMTNIEMVTVLGSIMHTDLQFASGKL